MVYCCVGWSTTTGISGWIPTPRFQPVGHFLNPTTTPPSLPPRPPPTPVAKPSPAPLPFPSSSVVALTPAEQDIQMKTALACNPLLPSNIPVKETIGKFLGLMKPNSLYQGTHEAIPLLNGFANEGCPVDCGPDWSRQQIELLLRRGPHTSAKALKAVVQLRAETKEKCVNGYARVVRWKELKNNIPPRLKISPVAMIPHKSKPFRCILDLSFRLKYKGKMLSSVNENTTSKSPPQAMIQLGTSIHRIIHMMAHHYAPHQPFKFAKLDIKDGFWRLAVNDSDAWNFCYILPTLTPLTNLDDAELVVPNSLQMGWSESPPLFCAASETARDIIQTLLLKDLPPHAFEHIMLRECTNMSIPPPVNPLTIIEVYVDDFIAGTNQLTIPELEQISRAMLHGIHAIFPPPSVTKHCGEDPISRGKLEKGEGVWQFVKEILGWIFDGEKYTIQLPQDKCKTICGLLRRMMSRTSVSVQKFQQLTGKLQHASLGIPGGKSLFTPLDMALQTASEVVQITPLLKQTLADWRVMVQYMAKHPTSIFQLVQQPPSYIAYTDACRLGAGGVWCSGTTELIPFLWKVEWPADIQQNLVCSDNPHGSITINDLELAGMLLGLLALEHRGISLTHRHIASFCDNSSAVSWSYKLRNSRSIIAGHLLRYMGLRLHRAKASSIIPVHIAGDKNDMADIISRSFKHGKYFDAGANLPAYFDVNFPLEQKQSWQECQLPPALVSSVIRCLRGEQLPMASLLRPPQGAQNTGTTGANTPLPPVSIPSSTLPQYLPSSVTLSQAHLLRGSGQASTAGEIKSELGGFQKPLRLCPRPLNWLDNQACYTAPKGNTNCSSSE